MELVRQDEGFHGLYSLWAKQNIPYFEAFEDLLEIAFSQTLATVRGIHLLVVSRELQAKDLGA